MFSKKNPMLDRRISYPYFSTDHINTKGGFIMLKAGLYIRVSTLEQAKEGYSIQAQTDKLTNYSKAKDYSIENTYIDPGYSGSKMERPALQRMIHDIETNKIDVVIVYKLDRLSRSQKDTLYLIEDVFLKNNVDFVSMQESFDTTSPFGRAMIGILSVFAQLERENIKERLTMGLRERAKSGKFIGTHEQFVPLGYRYENDSLLVNPYEALAVKEIFDLFQNGESLFNIAKIISTKYTLRKKMNSDASVKYLLKNQTYKGLISYKGEWFDGDHEKLIEDDQFNAIQDILDHREKFNLKPFKYISLLSGFCYCGKCGARYKINSRSWTTKTEGKKTKHIYECYSRSKNKPHMVVDPNCKNTKFEMFDADDLVIKQIMDLDILALEKEAKSEQTSLSFEKEKTEITHLYKQKDRIIDMYEVGSIDRASFISRLKKVNDRISEIELILASEEITEDVTDMIETIKSAQSFDWTSEDLDLKRFIVQTIISRVIFHDDSIEIIWRL